MITNYNIVVINTKTPFDREMIDIAKSLQLIVRLGSGLEIIDTEYAKVKEIQVLNTPEGNRQSVAEHALGLLLALLNRIIISNYQVKDFSWLREANRGTELNGKTVGIIGFGNTGSSFAKILSGFDVKILAYDKYKQRFADNYRNVIETEMTEIFENCDILSLHIPLTSETFHLGDVNYFKKFKKDIFLLNTARGKIIKTEDLIGSLKSGKIKGAALDVLENENFKSFSQTEKVMLEELFSFPNVIVTPHIAGWTHESKEKIALLTYKSIIQCTQY
jgi:D-3-phosphoglycerate dehydrogenase